ncbi:putative NAD kinase Utr1 [Talaromyces proteolyticus]|uniref:NAD kinase Utr1 n=1 Tax=Talaromyces proteolyticus TaxID=1131652 RepID=A0AAD4PWK0_9EURO|nr:putative NAD kinase Utr1 [Talaromyces proteolyticus]KAH8692597.1 putative NAD kinase Utr1 [Talaromyces proteolyticus]
MATARDDSSANAGIRTLMPAPTEMPAAFTHPILSPSTSASEAASPAESASKRPSLAVLQPSKDAGEKASAFLASRGPSSVSSVGGLLLRDYARTVDPSSADQDIHVREHSVVEARPVDSVHQQVERFPPVEESASQLSTAAIAGLRSRSFYQRRRSTLLIDSIPRQTIMKALASRSPRDLNTLALPQTSSLNGVLNRSSQGNSESTNAPQRERTSSNVSGQKLSDALSGLQLGMATEKSSPTARLALQSPCFFHQRFEELVNIQKVLEEIADDEWLSHSRLVQTATGVREVSKQLQRRPIKRAVKTVMIVTKARDNRLVLLTRELTEWLLSSPRYGRDVGVNVYVDSKLRNSKRFNAPGLLAKDSRFETMLKYWTPDMCWTSPEKFDLVLTLGGDGTVLFTSWLFQRIVPPILSFSLGSLGFLTNFEFEKYKEHLNHVMGEGGMRVNLRMRFTCTVYRADRSKGATPGDMVEGEQFEVLNELVIDRGPSPYVSNLELYGDNELLTVIQADGCIFSTPTGSTAYSLSAGGSLIHPSIPGILLTPICPHTLSFRPMVLSDTMLLRISVPDLSRSTAYCSFDGKGRVELRQGDYVTVEASQYPFPTVVSGGVEWFDSVRRALRWNVRGAVQKGWSGGDGEYAETGGADDDAEFDIDFDSTPAGTDSGIGPSEDGDAYGAGTGTGSPMRRQMSLLNM